MAQELSDAKGKLHFGHLLANHCGRVLGMAVMALCCSCNHCMKNVSNSHSSASWKLNLCLIYFCEPLQRFFVLLIPCLPSALVLFRFLVLDGAIHYKSISNVHNVLKLRTTNKQLRNMRNCIGETSVLLVLSFFFNVIC